MSPGDTEEPHENTARRDREPDAAGRASAGALLREARLAAGLDAVRLASDLRISAQALEALETGQYHLLPGDPYVRALLSSLARQLRLDPQAVVQTYIQEMGLTPAQGQVAPYQDRGEKHSNAHRQIFAAILVLLLIGFVVVWRQLNRSQTQELAVLSNPTTSPTVVDSVSEDSLPESRALRPDTTADTTLTAAGSVEAAKDTAKGRLSPPLPVLAPAKPPAATGPVPMPAATPAPAATAAPAAAASTPVMAPAQGPEPAKPAKPDTSAKLELPDDPKPQKLGAGAHIAVFQALGESLWVKVMRDGKPDDIRLLQKGKSLQVAHSDTVRIALSRKGALELTLDGKSMQPNRKRFKILGNYYRPY